MKCLLLVFLVIFSYLPSPNACMLPNQGEEYDSLLKIDKLAEKNIYNMSFPRNINNSKGKPSVYLNYVSNDISEGCVDEVLENGIKFICVPKDSYDEEIYILNWQDTLKEFFWLNGSTFQGSFKIHSRKGYSVYVGVIWNSPVCLTFASGLVKTT
jgi:hypothetical protein